MSNKNSFGAFARSSRRASNFRDIQPILRAIQLSRNGNITQEHRHRENEDVSAYEEGVEVERDDSQFPGQPGNLHQQDKQTPLLENSDGQNEDAESSLPLLRSKLSNKAHDRVEDMNRQREKSRAKQEDDDREPLLIKKIKRYDGTEAEVIIGQSTVPQTIFNTANVLIGVGMLSLPLGIRYAGWIFGIGLLVASAFATKYTASLLAKCLDTHSSLANFADIAYVAYGEKGRFITTAIFTLELIAACIGLVILFADSLQSLIDGLDAVHWKTFAGLLLIPLNFLPMAWLSYTSFLGIFCGILLIIVTFVAGFLKSSSPGSLIEVATTHALPESWKALPLSFGLLLSLWGGHSVLPQMYRDMRHPNKYDRALNVVFSFVTSVDISMAVIGYLMYGSYTKDEISTNVLIESAYPYALKVIVLISIAIVSLTKLPLNCAPIVSTLEVVFSVDPRAAALKPNRFNQSRFWTRLLRSIFRIGVTIIIILLAILVPTFELVSAIMGAAFCSVICLIMPVVFHLKMFQGQITKRELVLNWILIVVSTLVGIVGTVWEFLPRDWMEL